MRIAADEAAEMFAHARVARLATVGTELAPHLVPVTFAVIEVPAPDLPAPDLPAPDLPALDVPAADRPASAWSQVIVFAVDHKPKSTTALRRLDNIAANPQVCFLVDRYNDDWQQLWWARADARAAVLDGIEREGAVAALVAKYPQYRQLPPAGVVVGSVVSRWTGWRAAPG